MTRKDMERLLTRYGDAIDGFCCHLAGSRDAGEELYQDTMLKVFELMDRIQIRDDEEDELLSVRNYCMGVAVRLFRNRNRREAMRAHLSVDDEENGLGYVISDGPDPEELYEKKQEVLSIRAAIRSLPEKHREVVYLFYYAEQSIQEIAETLHIPQGTVKSRLNHAKKALGRLLKEEFIW